MMNEKAAMTHRLFIATPIPSVIQGELVAVIRALAQENRGAPIRWVGEEHMHLTLHFLGNQETAVIDSLKRGCADVAKTVAAGRASLGHFDGFPNLEHPQTIFVKVCDINETLNELHGKLATLLMSLRVPVDDRPRVHHLTLGRVKVPCRFHIGGVEPPAGEWAVDSFQLMESQLTSAGPIHTVVADYGLRITDSSRSNQVTTESNLVTLQSTMGSTGSPQVRNSSFCNRMYGD